MITVTDIAREKIIELRSKEGKTDNHNIRVAVQGGGCSGLMYDLEFDAEIREKDEVFEDVGQEVLFHLWLIEKIAHGADHLTTHLYQVFGNEQHNFSVCLCW